MASIKPTFTLTSNKNTATTPGPLSVALSLSATDTLTVDNVRSEIVTVPFSADGDNATLLIDGSAYSSGGAPGTDGGFVWLKNCSAASSTNKIYVGLHPSGVALDDLAVAVEDQRLCTLFPGEFAWFPFDYQQDIVIDASIAGQKIEYWIFDRG
jgi:hypothetical protein